MRNDTSFKLFVLTLSASFIFYSSQKPIDKQPHINEIGSVANSSDSKQRVTPYKQGTGPNLSCLVEIRDVNTQNSSVNSLLQPGCWWTDFGENFVIKNNKIVFFRGGWFDTAGNKFHIYDILTGTWSIGVLDQSVQNASLISVNNTIYVAGGYVNGILSNQVWKLEF